jgi:hypothetical protein
MNADTRTDGELSDAAGNDDENALASLIQDPGRPGSDDPTPLRAVHTPSFPDLLRQLSASLLVTTY